MKISPTLSTLVIVALLYCLYRVMTLPYSTEMYVTGICGSLLGFYVGFHMLRLIANNSINKAELESFKTRKPTVYCTTCVQREPSEDYYPHCSLYCRTAPKYITKGSVK